MTTPVGQGQTILPGTIITINETVNSGKVNERNSPEETPQIQRGKIQNNVVSKPELPIAPRVNIVTDTSKKKSEIEKIASKEVKRDEPQPDGERTGRVDTQERSGGGFFSSRNWVRAGMAISLATLVFAALTPTALPVLAVVFGCFAVTAGIFAFKEMLGR